VYRGLGGISIGPFDGDVMGRLPMSFGRDLVV
jgi:hypothetical protein